MSHSIHSMATSNPMWVFEANYRLLERLLPDLLDVGDEVVLRSKQAIQVLSLSEIEHCKYTTLLNLRMPFTIDSSFLPDLQMALRVYHDAQVVEVHGYQGCQRIPPRYWVRQHDGYQKDDRRQINHLLYDLLRYCLRFDYRISDLVDTTPV